MNPINRRFLSRIAGVAMTATLAAGLASCDSAIYDDLDPCEEGVELRFVYDYNMEYANAFYSQVDCLTLLVYDADGRYVTTRTETSPERLADENYRMTVDLPAGRYHLVAYGGMECAKSTFSFTETPAAGTTLGNLEVKLSDAVMQSATGVELHPLFFGDLDIEVEAQTLEYKSYTLPMMKDTNNLRIVLQQLSGAPLDGDDFSYTITADNTLLNYDNDVVATSKPFTYREWTRGTATAGTLAGGDDLRVAFGELSFNRLMADATPTLAIYSRTAGREIVRLPLIDYLLLTKSEGSRPMSDQEYLDRESRWSMIFFLDANQRWVQLHLVVNNWVVRVNNPELGLN